MTLDQLKEGKKAVVTVVGGQGLTRKRLLEMGLTPKTHVTMVKRAPLGDPLEIELRGYHLTLRLADAARITVEAEL